MFIFERDRESASGGGAERQGDTESEAGSRLWVVSTVLDTGLQLTNCEIVTWAVAGCLTDWATQVPPKFLFFLSMPCVGQVNLVVQEDYSRCIL